MKLVYILNTRVPTERAHGLQSMRMCEALIESDVEVTLMVPRRIQNNPTLRNQDAFAFYGLSKPFPICRVPHLDLLPLEPYVGLRVLRPFLVAASSAFAMLAALYARSMKADLYFTREWSVAWWLVRLGLPTVYEAHVVDGISFSPRAGIAMRNASRNPAMLRVVAITEAVKHDLVAFGVPEEKVIVLPDAVDIQRYSAHERPEAPWEQKDGPVAVYTGSLFRSQGVFTLVDAAGYMKDVRLLLLGGSPEDQELVQQYVVDNGLTNVVTWGHVPPPEVPGFQQAADVLVYTPLGDDAQHMRYASPLKLFQYMAAGRPIVSTDLPSIREVLSHEETALLVRPNDPAAVADAINRLLSDPELAQRLARNARLKVEEFTWQNRVRRLPDAVNPDYLSILKIYA